MKCETAREHFSDLIEGGVDQATKLAIDSHFSVCPACREEYASFKQTWLLLDDVPTVEAPAYLRHQVLQAIRDQAYESIAAPRKMGLDRVRDFFVLPGFGRRLAWSSAALCGIVLVGAGIVKFPGPGEGIQGVAIGISPEVKTGLAAIQVTPEWQNGAWQVVINGAQELTLLRIYQPSTQMNGPSWSTNALATDAPTRGLVQAVSTIDFVGSHRFSPQLSSSSGVSLIVVHLASGGVRRDVAVYLPSNPGQGISSSASQGQDVLSNSLWRLANDYQVAIVADAGQDTGISANVLQTHRSGAANMLSDVARQARMEFQVVSQGVYRLTTK